LCSLPLYFVQIAPHHITPFLFWIQSTVPAELTSSSGISNCLQLCCTRVVFSRLRLNGHLSALASPAELAADLKFLRRLRWLQCAEQGALGIEPYFQYYWDSPEAERLVDGDPRAVVWPPRLQLLCTALLQLSAPTPLAAPTAASSSAAAASSAFTFPLHRRGGRSLKPAAASTPKVQSHASTPTAAALASLPTLRRDCLVRRSCWKPSEVSSEHSAAAVVGGSAESFQASPADAASATASWHASEVDPEFPFARAIARLSRIRDLCVPEDILRELLATVREIHLHVRNECIHT
jgi:hypothetical protein